MSEKQNQYKFVSEEEYEKRERRMDKLLKRMSKEQLLERFGGTLG